MALTKLLAGQTSASPSMQDQNPTLKKRRFIPSNLLSSDEDTPLTCPTSETNSPNPKDGGIKVYKRKSDLSINSSGTEPADPSPSQMDSLVQSPEAMLVDPVENPNLLVASPDKIVVDTSNLPVNLPMDLPEDTFTLPDESSG